jgi:hypothetical protein
MTVSDPIHLNSPAPNAAKKSRAIHAMAALMAVKGGAASRGHLLGRMGFRAPSLRRRPIELRIREIGQLFHSLDPLPFRERDLDERVEEYVVGWAGEMAKAPVNIVIHLPMAEARREEAAHIHDAMRNYFEYRAEVIGWELRDLFRIGRTSLAVGLAMLASCVVLGQLLESAFRDDYLSRFFDEGLIILGWVANWRPIQIFLYDWQPLARRRRLYGRLAKADVKLSPYGS